MSSIVTDGRFSIAGTLELTLRIVARAAWRLIGIAVLEIVVVGLLTFVVGRIFAPLSSTIGGIVDFLIEQAGLGLASGAAVAVSFAAAEGRPCGIGKALAAGARRLVPVAIVCLLQSLAIAIGFFFLVVPGVVLAVLLVAAVPVCMVEEVDPFESFSRSAVLTKGRRLRVCGLLAPVSLVALLAFAAMLLAFFHSSALTVAAAILGALAILALMLAALALPTAVYLTLRASAPGEGLGPVTRNAL